MNSLISHDNSESGTTIADYRQSLKLEAIQRKQGAVYYELNGDILIKSKNGAVFLVGQDSVMIQLPYPVSANQIWRAKTVKHSYSEKHSKRYGSMLLNPFDQEDVKATNTQSKDYKNFKLLVKTLYAPIFRAIGWQPIKEMFEVRLIVQPKLSARNHTAFTYPRYDTDNYFKAIFDSMNGLLYQDDKRIIHPSLKLAKPVQGGAVWLSCIRLSEQEQNWLEQDVDFNWLQGAV